MASKAFPALPGTATLKDVAALARRPHLVSLADFVRARLGDVSGSLAALRRLDDRAVAVGAAAPAPLREAAMVITAAVAPFAPTSYARARLLRQMHACGLLSPREAAQVEQLFDVAQ